MAQHTAQSQPEGLDYNHLIAEEMRSRHPLDQYGNGFGATNSDDDVLTVAHHEFPAEMAQLNAQVQADKNPIPQALVPGSNNDPVANALTNGLTNLNTSGQSGIGNLVEWAGKNYGQTAGNVAAGLGTLAGTALQAGTSVLKAGVREPLSMVGGFAPEAGAVAETGGSLLGPSATENVAAMGRAKTGLPTKTLLSALGDPSMLAETQTQEQVGDKINALAASPEFGGLQTGKNARRAMASVQAKFIPKVGTGAAEADATWARIGQVQPGTSEFIPSDIEKNADQISLLQDHFTHANEIADDINRLKMTGTQEQADIAASEGLGASGSTADDVRKSIAQRAAPLIKQAQKDLQDLVSARGVASSQAQATGLASPDEAVDSALAPEDLQHADNVIVKVMNALKPGSGDTYAGLMDEYHRAMVRKQFSTFFPQNANGTPSVFRVSNALGAGLGTVMGGIAGGAPGAAVGSALGTAGSMALNSPAVWARAIRTAAYLKDFPLSTPITRGAIGLAAGEQESNAKEGASNGDKWFTSGPGF